MTMRPWTPYYETALSPELAELWGEHYVYGDTRHIREMSAYRMLTSFYDDGLEEIENRRRLLFAMLDGPFATEKSDDVLNIFRGTLPVDTFLPKIVRARATAYNEPVTRSWSDAVDEHPDTARLRGIYQDHALDGRLQAALRYAVALSGCIVGVYVGTRGRLQVEILTPDLCRYETAEGFPDQLVSLTKPLLRRTDPDGVPLGPGDSVVVYQVWYADRIEYQDASGKPCPYPAGPDDGDGPTMIVEQTNPYGRIPYAIMRLVEPNSMATFGGGLLSSAEACLVANKLRWLADASAMYEGWGHIVAINLGMSSGSARVGLGRMTALDNVEAGAETGKAEPGMMVVSQNGQYASIDEYRRAYIAEAQRTANLPESMIRGEGGTPPSGISRFIERLGLLELRRSDELNLRQFEQEFSDLVVAVYNADMADAVGEQPLAEGLQLSVEFPAESLILEPDKEFELATARFMAGLISPREYVQEVAGRSFDSDEEAIAWIKENRAWAESLGGAEGGLLNTVGGAAQVADRQKDYYDGTVPREAVAANLINVSKVPAPIAESLLPLKDETPPTATEETT